MTLEQKRAALAFKHVRQVKESTAAEDKKADRNLYGSMAQKLPVLIRTAGLCQALHFVRSRKKDVLDELLDHLAEQLKRAEPDITGRESLCEQAREADLQSYLWLSREALASAEWYARLAQSELDVPRGTGDRP